MKFCFSLLAINVAFTLIAHGSTIDTAYHGVHFERSLSWKEIKDRARAERKYIFVDCYATWCSPCKRMDREVYPVEKVGNFMNAHFISVKVQLDSSDKDDRYIRQWYSDAKAIIDRYAVKGFPTYLYFSPDGEIVHRAEGSLSDSIFLLISSNSLDSNRQYYTVLRKYQRGQLEYESMPNLIQMAYTNGDKGQADRITVDYLRNYLDRMSEEQAFSVISKEFMRQYILNDLSSGDQLFEMLYHDGWRYDEITHSKEFSMSIINSIITREEINPKLWPESVAIKTNPNWAALEQAIARKYGEDYSQRTVLMAKLRWYNEKKDWREISRYTVQKIDKFGLDTIGAMSRLVTNNIMYGILFQHSTDSTEIEKAVKWMREIVDLAPNDATYIDTYANLLYKSGEKRCALKWERQAHKISPNDTEIQEALKKMEKGEPTWPTFNDHPSE